MESMKKLVSSRFQFDKSESRAPFSSLSTQIGMAGIFSFAEIDTDKFDKFECGI